MRLNINTGDKYGKLTVIKETNSIRIPSGQINRIFLCKCDCGFEKEIRLLHLCRGRIISCGCVRSGGVRINSDDERRLRKVYRQICKRISENYFESHLYFKKGITLYSEWVNNIDEFTKWSLENGYKEGLVIDRIDNSKGYSPNNCRWTTQKTNSANRDNTFFIVYKGEKIAFTELLDIKNLSNNAGAIRGRIKRGWSVNEAIDTPIKDGNYNKLKGLTQ